MYHKKNFILVFSFLITHWCTAMQHQDQANPQKILSQKIFIVFKSCDHPISLQHWCDTCPMCGARVWCFKTNTERKRDLVLFPDKHSISRSPDGQKKFYSFSEEAERRFCATVNFIATNGNLIELTEFCTSQHKWSPDSKFLLVEQPCGGAGLYDAETGESKKVFCGIKNLKTDIQWSDDRQRIFVTDFLGTTRIYRIARSNEHAELLLEKQATHIVIEEIKCI